MAPATTVAEFRRVRFNPQATVLGTGLNAGDVVVTLPLLPEGRSAVVNERTALLTAPATRGAMLRMARARRRDLGDSLTWSNQPAWLTRAMCGLVASTLWWCLAAVSNHGESRLGVPAVAAMLCGGTVIGACFGLLSELSDDGTQPVRRGALYEV